MNGAHTRGRFQKAPALPASSRVIEPFLGFLFTQTGFRCAEPLEKSFKTDRRQFVNLLGSARALGRLFVVHTNRKSLRRPNTSASLAFAFVMRNAASSRPKS